MAGRWARFFFKSIPGWSIRINSQLANISDKTYVIVANHESSTDILALYFLETNFSWLSKIELFRFPLVGTAMRWSGCIPVKRSSKTSRAKVIKLCEEVIKKGLSIVFFPEGTRSTSGQIKEFKMGAFSLSQKTNTPILPIVIKGSNTLLKKGSLAFNKSIVHIQVLNPIFPQQNETLNEYTSKVQKLMKEEHQRL
jgi:1-acyl-sn-glycerol-3-phosphate acyltransferase